MPGMLWENQVQRNRNRQNLYVFGVYGFEGLKSRKNPGAVLPSLTLVGQTTYKLVVFSTPCAKVAKSLAKPIYFGLQS